MCGELHNQVGLLFGMPMMVCPSAPKDDWYFFSRGEVKAARVTEPHDGRYDD